jgi:serine/threonine-protein kinase HipA
LPGAVKAVPVDARDAQSEETENEGLAGQAKRALRFSLAGVQLKFSALRNRGKNGGLTIPVSGTGGDWIVKLPSARHPDIPENEYAAMSLASKLGIDVPDIDLVPLNTIEGLPDGITRYGASAYGIRRFDRSEKGAIHVEDFAQVYGVYADEKYDNASYRQILSVLAIETDEASAVEFVRRLTYCVLIGNGDMHLKNWSLIYPDRRRPILAPAYDLLSTVAYIPNEDSALKFHRSRDWESFTYRELETIADKARLPSHLVVSTTKETVEQFDALWDQEKAHLPFSEEAVAAIDKHRKRLAV